ncbi:ATP-binding protein [Lichenihabitans sp. Uapishka_5]|uniref:sensor histidine kinase n=1 Tax=Lichenihabitans sp. Uapishka_5 TaxID=3037302 RepID=UPI0029E7CE39|nr:ATP-binding protein [Lichenihabitans sp. Uapishka_5]MDX7951856.1 ATP-binding protein [Lichenihabitans sp. Uapishka_5]
MNQVFSRWPSLAPTSRKDADAGVERRLPAWMRQAPPSKRSGGPTLSPAAALAVLGSVATTLGGYAAAALSLPWGMAFGALGVAAAACSVMWILRLRNTCDLSEARETAIFERAGISMWREDWTAAAKAVMALRLAGVEDLESHFASRPDALRAIRASVMIKDVNSFTLEETGAPSKAAYLGSLDRLLPDTDQTFVQWLVAFGRGDRFFRSEAHVTGADGQQVDVLFTAMLPTDLTGFGDILVTSLDITAFKRAQAQLVTAETQLARRSRVATVGALSASIAHEVNSPLTAIVANAQAALRWLRRPEPDHAEAMLALEDVVRAATRARDVVARTRSFIGNAPHAPEPLDLVEAARDANLLVERDMRELGATIHLAPEEGVPRALADLVQIQQVFVNLFLNAAQAMADVPGPRDVSVAIQRRGTMVVAAVSDTGPGIAPDRRGTIFDPFHSTKPGGMGMGLAICRNCIDANGGDIWVEAAPGGGAAFHFAVPTSDG